MKFCSFLVEEEVHYGVAIPEQGIVWDLTVLQQQADTERSYVSLFEGIQHGEEFLHWVNELMLYGEQLQNTTIAQLALSEIQWLPPVIPRKNVMCVGKNYRDHAIEMGSEQDIPQELIVFTKNPTALIGHCTPIDAHQGVTSEVDYEGELAVVIGKKGKNISESEALQYVFGYTIINDVTARDLQQRHQQYFIGKSLDTFGPIGPWIVHSSEIENPNALHIETRVNGEIRQSASTEQCLFTIQQIISILSKGMTLEPGDIIATGTPSGVGKGFQPPKFLVSGDRIDISIEKIGTLSNLVK
jgi:2-keto-4-pentenoate hydratase/2-oxohepta-3-ene-1,7-dioic acid hydratase in catechol pathway